MIALSSYKLANYLADTVQFPKDYMDVNWRHIYGLAFAEEPSESRNRCFICVDDQKDKFNFFFKQSRSLSESNLHDIRSEAQFYKLVPKNWSALGGSIPKFVSYDDYNSVIMTDYVRGIEPIIHQSTATFREAGAILRTIHDTCLTESVKNVMSKSEAWIDDFKQYVPRIISLTKSETATLKRRNNTYVDQLLTYVTQGERAYDWRAEWEQGVKGLIHGDADARNFGQRGEKVVLFDFEYVSYGAWFWDLAAFVASLLKRTDLPNVRPRTVTLSTSNIYPSVVKFCIGYGIDSEDVMKQILRWAGIYLLQLFISDNDTMNFKYGLTLIEDTNECYEQIFKPVG